MSKHRLPLFASAFVIVVELAAFAVLSTPSVAASPVVRGESSPHTAAAPSGSPHRLSSTGSRLGGREVFGFALASSLGDSSIGFPSWDFSLLSTVAVFGLHVNTNGMFAADAGWSVWNSSTLTNLLATAHSHGTKVVVTLVLQDFQAGTPSMCAGLTNRAVTVQQAVAQVTGKGVDGVNVDYEGLNGTCPNGQTAQSMMTDFIRQLRSALPSGSYLSVDTYASSAADSLGFFNVVALNPYVDSFFVMAYDLEYSNYRHAPTYCSSFCLGPTAPLAGYYYNDTSTASQYMSVVPASKVILGVPYYGRKACVGSAVANAYPNGSVVADSYLDASGESAATGVQAGSYAIHRDANDPAGSERWDTWYNTSLGCTRELYWDDATSLGAKYDLVNRDGLRGVGIWSLNYGGAAPELWSALLGHFGGCTGASLSPATTTQPTGAAVTLTATATGCASPRFAFWIQYPSGTWYLAQGFGGPTLTWNTAGLGAGNYLVHVWANTHGNGYDAVGESKVTLTPCTSASISPANPSVPAGSVGTYTASSTGCLYPRYAFWVQYPGGTWQLAQGFGGPKWVWNTAGLAPGTYVVHVWVNRSGNGYDAIGETTVTLTGCTSASLTPATASAPAGSTVSYQATSSGCPNPVYEFWVQYPGGSWHLLRGFGPPGYSWNTVGLGAGAYTIHVWANQQGAAPTLEVFGSSSVTLVPTCTSAAVTPASGSAPAGSAVKFSVSATGCSTPVYEFWLLDPAGKWHVMQLFAPSATWTWNTTGWAKGTYTIHVWADQQGTDPAVHEAIASGTFTLT